MMLFHPYRSFSDDILYKAGLCRKMREDEACLLIWEKFVTWRDGIYKKARPYFDRSANVSLSPPQFDTDDWWACMIYERLRNYEAARQSHEQEVFDAPRDMSMLPLYQGGAQNLAEEGEEADRCRVPGKGKKNPLRLSH